MAVADKDLELWKKWKKSRSPHDLEKLINQLNPLIQAEVNRRAGTLARPALVGQATALAVKAIKSFDPSKNVKLSTHVANQIQKLSRMNYAHQNAARIPEHTMLQFQTVQIAKEDFKANEGREPSYVELADTLGWSPKKVQQFNEQFGRAELIESGDVPGGMFVSAEHDPSIDYAYYSMTPRQQKIFEFSTGYQGAPRLSNGQIMKKLGITQGVLSYEKNKIKTLLKRVT